MVPCVHFDWHCHLFLCPSMEQVGVIRLSSERICATGMIEMICFVVVILLFWMSAKQRKEADWFSLTLYTFMCMLCTHAQIHMHTHALTHTHTHTHTPPHTHMHARTYACTHTHMHAHTLTLYFSVSHTHTHTHYLSLSLSLSPVSYTHLTLPTMPDV